MFPKINKYKISYKVEQLTRCENKITQFSLPVNYCSILIDQLDNNIHEWLLRTQAVIVNNGWLEVDSIEYLNKYTSLLIQDKLSALYNMGA